jgi:hypothetical protein
VAVNDATLRAMQKRTLLKVGLAAGALFAIAGGTLALLQPARREGRFGDPAQAMLAAVARAVLGELLPQGAAQAAALQGLVKRLEETVASMPPAMQGEVDELFTIAASAPGRVGLIGLGTAWQEASIGQVTDALQALRFSSLAMRQQAYHALRDLTNAAWFADASSWAMVGYPGPRPVPSAEARA